MVLWCKSLGPLPVLFDRCLMKLFAMGRAIPEEPLGALVALECKSLGPLPVFWQES